MKKCGFVTTDVYIEKYISIYSNRYIVHLYSDTNILIYRRQYIDTSDISIRCHPYMRFIVRSIRYKILLHVAKAFFVLFRLATNVNK